MHAYIHTYIHTYIADAKAVAVGDENINSIRFSAFA